MKKFCNIEWCENNTEILVSTNNRKVIKMLRELGYINSGTITEVENVKINAKHFSFKKLRNISEETILKYKENIKKVRNLK